MAIHSNHFSGSIGPLIFYVRNGKQYSRSRPGKVKQTEATKKRSSNFGLAAKLSAVIRRNMKDLFRLKDGTLHNRLTTVFSAWLATDDINTKPSGTIKSFADFNINPDKISNVKWNESISVSQQGNAIQVKLKQFIPKNLMAAPRNTNTVRVTIVAVCFFIADMKTSTITKSYDMPYDEAFSGSEFEHEFPAINGRMMLVGFVVECFDNHGGILKWRKGYNAPGMIRLGKWIAS